MLAQRLLINMRKVDYMGSEPVASKLLFAPAAPDSDDDIEEDFDSDEIDQGSSGMHHHSTGDQHTERFAPEKGQPGDGV